MLMVNVVRSLMKSDDILEMLKVAIDLTCILKRLCECDTGEGADFSETLTDLKWVRMTLDNRLKSVKGE